MTRVTDPSDRLLDLIYDAATEPEKWRHALLEIADATDSVGCHIFGADSKPGTNNKERIVTFSHLARLDQEIFNIYSERHVISDLSETMDNSPNGKFVLSDSIVPLDKLRRTALFDEVWGPLGVAHCAMVSLAAKEDFRVGLVISRGERIGPHNEAELNFFSRLYPHIRRSLGLGFRFDGYRELQQARFDILERLTTGVALLDRKGRLIYANNSAKSYCRDESGLNLIRRGVLVGSRVHAARLSALIQKAILGDPGGVVTIPLSDGRLQTIVVSSVRSRDIDRFGDANLHDAAVILFIVDPANRVGIPAERIMDAYGLTQAEAKVAIAIASGYTIQGAALAFGSSPNTIKTHLRRAFEKTGSKSQADLARLIVAFNTIDTALSD